MHEWTRRDRVVPKLQRTQGIHYLVNGHVSKPDEVEHILVVRPCRVSVAGALGHERLQSMRRRADLHVLGKEGANWLVIAVDHEIGLGAESGKHSIDEGRIVDGVYCDGIACAVADPGVCQFDFVVPDLLVGFRRVEQPVDGQPRLERLVASPARLLGVVRELCRRRRAGGRSGARLFGSQHLENIACPCGGRFLVEPVDVDTVGDSGGAEGFQPLIEELARVAEEVVGDVAEGEYGEAQVLEPIGCDADRFPEQHRVVGELAIAERRGHHDEVGCRLQIGEFDLVEFDRLGIDADGRRGLGERHRGVLGITHIGAEGNDQRKVGSAGHLRTLPITSGTPAGMS